MFMNELALLSLDATTAECAEIFWPGSKASPSTEYKVVGRQGDAALRDYLALIRRAIFAELDRSPAAITLSAAQEEAAEQAFLESAESFLSDLPSAQRERLTATFQNMEDADLKAKCDAMIVITTTAAKMDGITGEWYRRKFVRMAGE